MGVAARQFTAHLNREHRTFKRGEEVPEEWAETVGAKHLIVDSLDPAPGDDAGGAVEPDSDFSVREALTFEGLDTMGFDPSDTMEEVLEWVMDGSNAADVRARASYAAREEQGGKNRATLLDKLGELSSDG